MDNAQLATHIRRLLAKLRPDPTYPGVHSEIVELLRNHVGPDNAYLRQIDRYSGYTRDLENAVPPIRANLEALLQSIEAGAHKQLSPERQIQVEVVSDFLEMAHALLETSKVHPAGPTVLIGATLEEFLRNWVDAAKLPLGGRNPGLETYSQVLREANLITKQDGKDIVSWAGLRNYAAHGQWNEVEDKQRIKLMLDGVNHFMRTHTPS